MLIQYSSTANNGPVLVVVRLNKFTLNSSPFVALTNRETDTDIDTLIPVRCMLTAYKRKDRWGGWLPGKIVEMENCSQDYFSFNII